MPAVACPKCHQCYDMTITAAGRSIVCQACGERFTVPGEAVSGAFKIPVPPPPPPPRVGWFWPLVATTLVALAVGVVLFFHHRNPAE